MKTQLFRLLTVLLCWAGWTAQAITFTVITTSDSGAGSLRQAILDANASNGVDTIAFNIPGSGVHMISPTNALPTITGSVVIDGYTQPGSSVNTLTDADNAVLLIELNGASAGNGVSGLTISAGNSTVRGLVINRFNSSGGWAGIRLITGGNNLIEGNFIGTDPTGTADLGNTGHGVGIASGSATNTVGGTSPAARNVIAGNGGDGVNVYAAGAGRNVIQGNFIGVDATGTNRLANGSNGVFINFDPRNTVGGTNAGARNVISGNANFGIAVHTANNVVQGNFIGVDATGATAIPNAASGILIGVATNNLIGGTTAAARNIISGNLLEGVNLNGSTGQKFNVVQGNFIGTDVTGTKAIGNQRNGVWVFGGISNYVGGAVAGAGNLISGNKLYGVGIQQADTNFVQGNFIGTDVTGTQSLSNSWDGVGIYYAQGNVIGGAAAGAGNTIAFNRSGVALLDSTSLASSVLGNSVFANAQLGIDLNNEGVTTNDNCDADTGANNLQNFPVITLATNVAGGTYVQGTLNSVASTTNRLEFFASSECDPSGYGEGEEFIGFTSVTTDAGCSVAFAVTLPVIVSAGAFITATATDPAGNTSEFSACVPVTGGDCLSPPIGMVSWWPGDGNATDAAGSNSGTLMSGAGFGSGKVGQAFSFDGVDDYVELGTPANLMPTGGEFTVEGWIRVTDYPTNDYPQCPAFYPIISFDWGWSIGVTGNGSVSFRKYISEFIGVGVTSASPISSNEFHHVVGVHTPTELWLFIDGALAATVSSPTGTIYYQPGETLQIGQQQCSSVLRNLKGQIDELAFYNRALSACEIAAIYDAGSAGKCKNTLPGSAQVSLLPVEATNQVGTAHTVTATTTTNGLPLADAIVNFLVFNGPNTGTNGCAVTGVSGTASFTYTGTSPGTDGIRATATATTASGYHSATKVWIAACPAITLAPASLPEGTVDALYSQTITASGSSATPFSFSKTGTLPAGLNLSSAGTLSGTPTTQGASGFAVTATDTNGCTGNRNYVLTINPASQPCTITCPASVVTNTAPGVCGATVTFNVASGGSCPGITTAPASGSFFNKGTTPVTVTTNGVTVCTFNIIVNDHEPPTLICPANIVTNLPAGVTNAIVNFSLASADDNCFGGSLIINPPSGSAFPLGTNTVVASMSDASGNTNGCSFKVIVQETPPETHDLALIKLKAPKNINLQGAEPSLTKFVKVTIQNRSPHDEVITNFNGLVTLVAESLSNVCPNATVVLHPGSPNNPKTLKPKQKTTVTFDVTWNCANDPLKGAGHEDYRYLATVHHEALDGQADTHPACDTCPRPPLPGGVDPNPDPNKPLKDPGCGNKDKTTGLIGADVFTDVVEK